MGKWAWFPLVGSVLGALVLISGLPSAEGAPQEAVVVALSATLAIIPYVFARAISELKSAEHRNLRQAELAQLIAREIAEANRIPDIPQESNPQ